MALSDFRYLGFLLLISVLFYILPVGKPRRILLLAASYYFYTCLSHVYVAVLLLTTALAFFGGLAIRAREAGERKGLLFGLVIATVLTPLLVLKYGAFFLNVAGGAFSLFQPLTVPELAWALPVGISFFTFVAVGYLIDVYLDVIEPENRPLYFGLFLAFFPLVSAGPIERAGRFMPQFDCKAMFTADNGFAALRLIFWGLVLKLLFADRLAVQVNMFFAAPVDAGALEKLFAMIHYVFYLYSDFAGYSLIAIGSARLLGLEVRPNFQQPFLSATVPDFWRHWHISLSSWVRDYLFSPLRTYWRRYQNRGMAAALIISFTILGLWHGAGWGFLAFGVMHGLLVTVSTFTIERRNAYWAKKDGSLPLLLHPARIFVTFLLVTLTFVVFRANSMGDALVIYRGIFSPHLWQDMLQLIGSCLFDYVPSLEFKFIKGYAHWGLIALLVVGDILVRKKMTLDKFPIPVQLVIYNTGLILLLYTWLSGNVAEPFLYYKF